LLEIFRDEVGSNCRCRSERKQCLSEVKYFVYFKYFNYKYYYFCNHCKYIKQNSLL